MTKENLINTISAETKISKGTTATIVESFFDCVKTSIANGEEVTLRRFGTFDNVLRREKNFHYAPSKIVPFQSMQKILWYTNNKGALSRIPYYVCFVGVYDSHRIHICSYRV